VARLLEDIDAGTPVFLGDELVGTVRAVYAEGDARLAEYLCVDWTARATLVLIPTNDVESLDDRGVVLMGDDPRAYDVMPAFDEASHPTIRKIR
jgi:hypothetical protein